MTGTGGNGGTGGVGGNLDFNAPTIIPPAAAIPLTNVAGGTGGTAGLAVSPGGTNGTPGANGANGTITLYDDGEDADELFNSRNRSNKRKIANKPNPYAPVAYVQNVLKIAERELPAANVLIAPTARAAAAQAGIARIEVSRGASAFVMNDGHNVYVLGLHDGSLGDVRVIVNNQTFKLRSGEQVVISDRERSSLKDATPMPEIAVRNAVEHKLQQGNCAFVSDFSIPSAIAHLHALKQMQNAEAKHHRSLYKKMLKNAAAQLIITGNRGAYRSVQ